MLLAHREIVEACLVSDFVPTLTITSRTSRPPLSVALLISAGSISSWLAAQEIVQSEVSLLFT